MFVYELSIFLNIFRWVTHTTHTDHLPTPPMGVPHLTIQIVHEMDTAHRSRPVLITHPDHTPTVEGGREVTISEVMRTTKCTLTHPTDTNELLI